jgi:hypothetical protein
MIPARNVMDVHALFCDEQVATTHTDCTVHLLTAPYLKCLMLSVCVY